MFFILTFFFFLLGNEFGSFLNVVAIRNLKKETLSGRSYCPNCKHQLSALDLIPLISFLLLNGKCRYCHKSISPRYFLVELVSGVLFSLVFVFWYFGNFFTFEKSNLDLIFLVTNLIFQFFVTCVLLVVVLTDLSEQIIPDDIVLPASLVSFFYLLFSFLFQTFILKVDLFITSYYFISSLIFTFLAAAFFLALIIFSKGKGMGGGDFKFTVFMGLALGWPAGLVGLFLAFLTGGIVSAMLLLIGKRGFKDAIPFGPFLALGAFGALLAGSQIFEWYLKTLGL